MESTQGRAEIKAPGRMKIDEKMIFSPCLCSNVWKTQREREICCTESQEIMEIKWNRGVRWTKRQVGYISLPLVQGSGFLLKKLLPGRILLILLCRVKESTVRIVCFRGERAWNVHF